jgi:hypothetical protein
MEKQSLIKDCIEELKSHNFEAIKSIFFLYFSNKLGLCESL